MLGNLLRLHRSNHWSTSPVNSTIQQLTRCCQPARSCKTQKINSRELRVHQHKAQWPASSSAKQFLLHSRLCVQTAMTPSSPPVQARSSGLSHMLLPLLSQVCVALSQSSGSLQAAMVPLTPPAGSCRCTWPSCRSSSARCWPSLQPSTSTSRRSGRQRQRGWRRRPCPTSGWWPWQQVGATRLAVCLRCTILCPSDCWLPIWRCAASCPAAERRSAAHSPIWDGGHVSMSLLFCGSAQSSGSVLHGGTDFICVLHAVLPPCYQACSFK